MKKRVSCLLIVLTVMVAAASLVFAGGAGEKQPAGKAVTIKVASYQPVNHPSMEFYKEVFFDEIEKRSNGTIDIEYLGGPEVIDTFDMGNAILNGILDMGYLFAPAYGDIVEGTEMLINSGISFEEEKKRGVFTYLEELHVAKGLHLMGRAQILPFSFFYFGGKTKIEKIADFKGTRWAAEFLLVNTLPKLGALPVSIPDDEAYSGIEKGVVDGYMTGIIDIVPLGWDEVTDYILDNPFFNSNDVYIISLKKWNELSKEQQEIMATVYAEMQEKFPAFYKKLYNEAREQLKAAGVTFTALSASEAKTYADIIRQSEFDEQVKRAPSAGPKLREMLTP